jgi:phosphoglycolate phosphatase
VIRLAVFDLDGTLVDSKDDIAHSVNHALAAVGLPARAIPEIHSFIGEGADRLIRRSVAPREDLLEPALSAWRAHYADHLLDRTRLYAGVAEALAGATVALAVHTNKPGRFARRILEGLGVLSRFRGVVGGDEAPRKPDPAGTLRLMAESGAGARETLYVGDSPIDLATATAAGLEAWIVPWGIVPTEAVRAAGATHFVRDAAHLAALLRG